MTLRFIIGMGSSHPRGAELIQRATLCLDKQTHLHLVASSGLYKNAAKNMPFASSYVNAAAAIETSLSPDALWLCLHKLEAKLGRLRMDVPHTINRPIDLDVLWYSGLPARSIFLTIPHPRLGERMFAKKPLAEVAQKLEWKDAVKVYPRQTL
jgi:2-amino-4-hydroxy-6-hydroxymethyldihydropteridine diphosphokinase